MATTSFQFSVATHIMAVLGDNYGRPIATQQLAESVNTDPTFVRKAISKLAKAGLVTTTRGKGGFCTLSRPPAQLTLRDIYLASEPPAAFAIHTYPVEDRCPISLNIKPCLSDIQVQTQQIILDSLAKTHLDSVVADIRQRGTQGVSQAAV